MNNHSCFGKAFGYFVVKIFFDQKIGKPTVNEAHSFAGFPISHRAFLAPMAGVTDFGMRRIAEQHGAGLTFSEMATASFYLAGESLAQKRMARHGARFHAVQIAARTACQMRRAAEGAVEAGADLIDINLGCPAKKVVGGLAGAALMREPEQVAYLVRAAVEAGKPVSVKMRLGWDETCRNAREIAKIAEGEGACFVTVHGRTRNQFYAGAADWAAISAVRETVKIPIVANGDCRNACDAKKMLQQSGAQAVMIGRAAIGRPWMIGEIAAALDAKPWRAPRPHEKSAAALSHLDWLLGAMGAKGLRHARKHLAAYADGAAADGFGLDVLTRRRLVASEDIGEVRAALEQCWSEPDPTRFENTAAEARNREQAA